MKNPVLIFFAFMILAYCYFDMTKQRDVLKVNLKTCNESLFDLGAKYIKLEKDYQNVCKYAQIVNDVSIECRGCTNKKNKDKELSELINKIN